MTWTKANCYIVAWDKYTRGEAVWMACRKSQYSRLYGRMWWPARAMGTALVWSATGVWLLGHFLKFGTWPHWIYCDSICGKCFEAVPITGSKSRRFVPPPLFDVKVQPFKGDNES